MLNGQVAGVEVAIQEHPGVSGGGAEVGEVVELFKLDSEPALDTGRAGLIIVVDDLHAAGCITLQPVHLVQVCVGFDTAGKQRWIQLGRTPQECDLPAEFLQGATYQLTGGEAPRQNEVEVSGWTGTLVRLLENLAQHAG